MQTPILTINIPTFNRAKYLERCLKSITDQEYDTNQVQINVYDNASEDSTPLVVQSLIAGGAAVNYFRNEKNIGADRNIGQAYYKAKSKYVWVLGDDDILLPGAISYLLKLLTFKDWGVVFFNFYQFRNDPITEFKPAKDTNTYIYKGDEILRYILSNVSFISSNIVNTRFISEKDINLYNDTNLNQIPGILNAIHKSHENLFVSKYYLAQQTENSGGFGYFTVFGKNYPRIVTDILGNSKGAKLIIEHIIQKMFPYQVVNYRFPSDSSTTRLLKKEENILDITKPYLGKYAAYWIIVYPLIKLPKCLVKIFYFVVKVYVKLYYMFLKKHHKKQVFLTDNIS